MLDSFYLLMSLSIVGKPANAKINAKIVDCGCQYTPQADFDAEGAGGTPVPSHHSPLFKVKGEGSVRLGVEATVITLRDLLPGY